MVTPPVEPTPPPAGPIRGDRATFSGRVDAFITWLGGAPEQIYALAVGAFNNADAAVTAATVSTAAAGSAEGSSETATAAATSAAASAASVRGEAAQAAASAADAATSAALSAGAAATQVAVVADRVAEIANASDPTKGTSLVGHNGAPLRVTLQSLQDGQNAGVVGYDTLANLNANLTPPDRAIAYVTNDPVPDNNNTYRKVGASGAGSWEASNASPVALLQARTSILERDTDEISYTPSRFTQLRSALVDSITGIVYAGGLADGTPIDTTRSGEKTIYVRSRFQSLITAVVDSKSGVVISGVAADGAAVGVGMGFSATRQPFPPSTLMHVSNFGQSLAVGVEGGPPISITQPWRNVMFDTIVNPVNKGSFAPLVEIQYQSDGNMGETGLAGWTAAYNARQGSPVPMLGTAIGMGGRPIVEFLKSSNLYYAQMIATVVAAKDLTASTGGLYFYGGTLWSQSEADVESTFTDYYNRVVSIATDLDADIRAITGQSVRPPFLMTQESAWTHGSIFTQTSTEIAKAAAMKAFPDLMTIVCPQYFFDYARNDTDQHMTNHSYRWRGEYAAKALAAYASGKPWRPLYPISVKRISSTDVLATFNVPKGHLVFDTVLVSDPGQKGFEYSDDSGPAALTVVEILGDNVVHVKVARPMGANPKLAYAFTGVAGAYGGKRTGPRGCLRDTDDAVAYYSDAGGTPYKLFNWCIHFQEPIQ